MTDKGIPQKALHKAHRLLQRAGFRLAPVKPPYENYMGEPFRAIYDACHPFTMTDANRMYALYKAVNYVLADGIEGDFVECGVWKGGSTMVMAKALMDAGSTDRTLYLYDTFAGMSEPTDDDVAFDDGSTTHETWQASQQDGVTDWAYSPLDEVERNVRSTGYAPDRFVFVKGKVEDTIPSTLPDRIALLRLDTDWKESTRHELDHLFPLVAPHGVVFIDDYDWFRGAREATDEYFAEHGIHMLLTSLGGGGVIGVKRG